MAGHFTFTKFLNSLIINSRVYRDNGYPTFPTTLSDVCRLRRCASHCLGFTVACRNNFGETARRLHARSDLGSPVLS